MVRGEATRRQAGGDLDLIMAASARTARGCAFGWCSELAVPRENKPVTPQAARIPFTVPVLCHHPATPRMPGPGHGAPGSVGIGP